jgi:ABC-2 type transport system ATP-binding protein
MIRCANITKSFSHLTAVNNITLDIPRGVCALLGPNGAGKSTLLKILTTLLPPDQGEVFIDNLDIQKDPLAVRRIIGVMPEDLGLFDSLSIAEHLELSGPIYGLSAAETRSRSEQLLRVLGLTRSQSTFLSRCSHGMRKKTSLALALLHNPRVVFLDEPFEGIDPTTADTIRDLLAGVARRGVTVFFTSHILRIVQSLATRTVMIRSGSVVWDSAATPDVRPLDEIYSSFFEPSPTEDVDWLRSPSS